MGVDDLLNRIGDTATRIAATANHTVGAAVDTAAQGAGRILDAVGLHGAAHAVADAGDTVADRLGDPVPEKQLEESNNPTELVHGDVAAITDTAGRLQRFADAFNRSSNSLRELDTARWHGDAAEAFRQIYRPHPRQWADAAQACTTAAVVWRAYGQVVHRAQEQAAEAVAVYQSAVQATDRALTGYAHAMDSYRRQEQAYQKAVAGGRDPGPAPRHPGPFTDPGQPARTSAQELLDAARHQRDTAAQRAASALAEAQALAPATPSFAHRVLDDISDVGFATGVEGEHVLGGVVKGVGDMLKLARSLIPIDPYNVTHPAAYVDGLSSLAAGVVHSVCHPALLAQGLVGTGWGNDPAEAFGRLLPNLAGVVGTGGAVGASARIARVAGEGAEGAAQSAIVDTASVASRLNPHLPAGGLGVDADAASAQQLTATGAGLSAIRARLDDLQTHLSPDTSPPTAHHHAAVTDTPPPELPRAGLATDPQVVADVARTAVHHPDLSVLDGLDKPVVWRRDSNMLYRTDDRGPEVFTDGLPARDVSSLDLYQHVNYNPRKTGYVSTTTDFEAWNSWGSNSKYFYAIEAPGGIDVNATLGLHRNQFEREIAMPGGIKPDRIIGMWPINHAPLTHTPSLGKFLANPHYRPLKFLDESGEADVE